MPKINGNKTWDFVSYTWVYQMKHHETDFIELINHEIPSQRRYVYKDDFPIGLITASKRIFLEAINLYPSIVCFHPEEAKCEKTTRFGWIPSLSSDIYKKSTNGNRT